MLPSTSMHLSSAQKSSLLQATRRSTSTDRTGRDTRLTKSYLHRGSRSMTSLPPQTSPDSYSEAKQATSTFTRMLMGPTYSWRNFSSTKVFGKPSRTPTNSTWWLKLQLKCSPTTSALLNAPPVCFPTTALPAFPSTSSKTGFAQGLRTVWRTFS